MHKSNLHLANFLMRTCLELLRFKKQNLSSSVFPYDYETGIVVGTPYCAWANVHLASILNDEKFLT